MKARNTFANNWRLGKVLKMPETILKRRFRNKFPWHVPKFLWEFRIEEKNGMAQVSEIHHAGFNDKWTLQIGFFSGHTWDFFKAPLLFLKHPFTAFIIYIKKKSSSLFQVLYLLETKTRYRKSILNRTILLRLTNMCVTDFTDNTFNNM